MPGAPSLTPSADQKPGLVAAWALKFSHEDPSTRVAAASPVPVVIGSSDYDADLTVRLSERPFRRYVYDHGLLGFPTITIQPSRRRATRLSSISSSCTCSTPINLVSSATSRI